jgi:hypothetical protein
MAASIVVPSAAQSDVPADPAGVVWLCRPSAAGDPCTADRSATVVPGYGPTVAQPAVPASPPPFDCFYLYPTVSRQKTQNADLRIQPAETAIAISQASRFSQVCNVWAPMYRQRTVASLTGGLGGHPEADAVAYRSALIACLDYTRHDNDGRPVIVIGHSQGAAMLIRILQSQVDANPTVRSRLVSALIIGGNVVVPSGKHGRGTFAHIAPCRSVTQTGCVIAYSSFPSQPPAGSQFGRPGQGISLQAGQTQTRGVRVLCTNPAALSGGTALLVPYFPAVRVDPGSPAPWVEYPDLYAAACRSAGSAAWLDVTAPVNANDVRPLATEDLAPDWGFHADDVNLALGNLVTDVASEEAAYRATHPGM